MARLTTEERQRIIIDEAIKIIHKEGYSALSIRELAQKVGISESAIYRHFLNKEDIILGILNKFSEFDEKLIYEMNLITAPIEKLRHFVLFHFEFLEKNRAMTSVIFSEYIFNESKILREKMNLTIQKRREIISMVIDELRDESNLLDIPTKNLVTVFLGVIRLVVLEWRLSLFSFSLTDRGTEILGTIEKMMFRQK